MSTEAAPSAAASGGEVTGPRVPDERPAPCPACGEPLFGWVVVRPAGVPRSREYVLDRCEACGLGIAREREDGDFPDANVRDVISAPNRRSWQAGIGGAHWGALAVPGRSVYPTPESLELLLEQRGLRAGRIRQPAVGRNQPWMWLTLMNAFTFHDGFAREVLRGRLRPGSARSIPAFAADAAVSTLAALPIAVISVALELLAVAFRRGGLIEAVVERRDS